MWIERDTKRVINVVMTADLNYVYTIHHFVQIFDFDKLFSFRRDFFVHSRPQPLSRKRYTNVADDDGDDNVITHLFMYS